MLAKAHALAIGISAYQHATALVPTRDAEDVAAVLADPALCGYPPGQVRLLREAEASREAIVRELTALASRCDAASTVFVYFSGHAARALAGDGPAYFLLPVDAEPTSRAALERTALSGDELSALLGRIPAARLTVVLDCCRASGLVEAELPLAPVQLSGELLSPLARGRGRAVLAASRGDGSALVLPGATHSVFTGHLLAGLRGAATAAGGLVRICDLFHYVQQATSGEISLQRPVFRAELEENYPVALGHWGEPLPPPPDAKPYDAFVTYAKASRADRQWVRRVLLPSLESRGLRIAHDDQIALGGGLLEESERLLSESRYSIAVMTPDFLSSGFEDYQALLAGYAAAEQRLPTFIPLLRRPCTLQLHRRMTAALDVTIDEEVPAALERLALALRQAPRPRLG